ncbi:MAG: TrbI/VirB10 family protein [Candidatus Obscuribacterales bacterium]|nr:TrbI/VirB10 family protein [Candidatus Obscuribacterales bacterium]
MKALPAVLVLCLTLPLAFLPEAHGQKSKRTDQNMYYRAPEQMGGKTVVIPIGTTFEGRINSTISSSKSHPGMAFAIVMSSPVLANGTDVVIPAGSEIIGEVVEAVPASAVPHKKRTPKPRGKLRVQLNSLRTPDGVTYPMVASLIGEEGGRRGQNRRMPIGTGVGYTGSASAFEAVSPAMMKNSRGNTNRGPQIISKQDVLNHEIFGMGNSRNNEENGLIRSLVLRKRDYWIDNGSPLSVKLNAPLKLGVTPQNTGGTLEDKDVEADNNDRLPQPSDTPKQAVPVESTSVAAPNPPTSKSRPSSDF